MKTRQKKPELQVLDLEELEKIIARAGLSETDRAKLLATIETLAWLQQELASKDVSLARLRSLFGLSTSEKTRHVLGDRSEGEPEDDAGTKVPELRQPKQKIKGHGRKAASDYEGADRIEIPHASLKSGDLCPECTTPKLGRVYTLGKPKSLVRVIGQAPLHATVYELERLRCNLCGKIFVAEAPPDVGDKKYDATAASMIGLLKYG